MIVSSLLTRFGTSAKLALVGSTIGPIVDALHNQCLLTYDKAPVSLSWPVAFENAGLATDFFCSSWTVPPLLGFAYLVLGGVLPRVFQVALEDIDNASTRSFVSPLGSMSLKTKALLAVTSTALIIKLSEILETHPHALDTVSLPGSMEANNLIIMAAVAAMQWITLDGTLPTLLAATLAGLGGPLAELPFVAHGFWHYLPQAADYFPLSSLSDASTPIGGAFQWLLGEDYRTLGLSSITGPCYFAVTMDAIALGRWFDSSDKE